MKALRYDGPWKMTMVDMPEPRPAPGEVLLRSHTVGICGSDVHGFTGESGRRKPGMVMGHEVVGRVVELGAGVTTFKVGDLAVVFNIVSCGRCVFCKRNQVGLCPDRRILGVNAGEWGAMAEYFTFPADCLFKTDPTMDPALALLAEPIGIAIHAVNLAPPGPDDTAAIVGSGTIGIALAIVLKHYGVKKIFALDKLPEKLELIRGFGAEPVNIETQDAVAVIKAATGGYGVTRAYEAVGAAATVRTAYDLCAPSATMVLIGNLAKEFTLPLQGVSTNEITIKGSYGFLKSDFHAAVELINKKNLPLERLITGSCTLEETPGVMTKLAKGELRATKMVIRI